MEGGISSDWLKRGWLKGIRGDEESSIKIPITPSQLLLQWLLVLILTSMLQFVFPSQPVLTLVPPMRSPMMLLGR